MDIKCALCGKIIEEDDEDYFDHDTLGHVHQSCLEEWEEDEPARADDYFFDYYRDESLG